MWQWQDEKRKWNPYRPEHTIALENGQQNKEESISLQIAGRNYTMDLTNMEQRNDETEAVRKIDRLKIGEYSIFVLFVLQSLHFTVELGSKHEAI